VYAAMAREAAERLRQGWACLGRDDLSVEQRAMAAHRYGLLLGRYKALCVFAGIRPERFPPLPEPDRRLAQRVAFSKGFRV
jgi:hypothetical protein